MEVSLQSPSSSSSFLLLHLALLAINWQLTTAVNALYQPPMALPTAWSPAHATFYGDQTASATMGGACGYGNLFQTGYGTDTAALSTTLFNNGFSCGTCYEIQCVDSPYCLAGSPTLTITATNLCPPNYAEPADNGGWCNPPNYHFDLSMPAFVKIAEWKAGIVPVSYRRVPCAKTGGIRFMIQGNAYWLLVYVMNVGASGDIASMEVMGGANSNWIPMTHNWGATYQAFATLSGQPLSFKITSYSTQQTIIATTVAPSGWTAGLTYEADVNFT